MVAKKFYQLSVNQRRKELIAENVLHNSNEVDVSLDDLNHLSENVVGRISLPLSVIKSVSVNQKKFMVPMATEEPSVVAAANRAIGIFNQNGGVKAKSNRDGIYGQVFFEINENFDLKTFQLDLVDLIDDLNETFSSLVKYGGGVKEITPFVNDNLLELRVLVDPAESMGANKTNSILEEICQQLIDYPGIVEKLYAILSNYPSQMTTAKVTLDFATLTKDKSIAAGKLVAQKIVLLSQIANQNVYRATTNNKGIMNGIDAVLIATGNDFRAVEVAAHASAIRQGQYSSLSSWKIEEEKLIGELVIPLAIGVVGGSIKTRADVLEAYNLLGDVSAKQLAEIVATIGLANNFSALYAISTTGIQAGHMKLHAKNIAQTAGATTKEVNQVAKIMTQVNNYELKNAKEIIRQLRRNSHENRD